MQQDSEIYIGLDTSKLTGMQTRIKYNYAPTSPVKV